MLEELPDFLLEQFVERLGIVHGLFAGFGAKGGDEVQGDGDADIRLDQDFLEFFVDVFVHRGETGKGFTHIFGKRRARFVEPLAQPV